MYSSTFHFKFQWIFFQKWVLYDITIIERPPSHAEAPGNRTVYLVSNYLLEWTILAFGAYTKQYTMCEVFYRGLWLRNWIIGFLNHGDTQSKYQILSLQNDTVDLYRIWVISHYDTISRYDSVETSVAHVIVTIGNSLCKTPVEFIVCQMYMCVYIIVRIIWLHLIVFWVKL